jgi:hypothetical protein
LLRQIGTSLSDFLLYMDHKCIRQKSALRCLIGV